MAKIGLKYPVFKGAKNKGVVAKAIQADIAITVNDVKLYADDALAESDRSFQSGTLAFGIDDLSDNIQAEFLGHTIDSETGLITAKTSDVSPYVGIGFYGVKLVSNVKKYRAIWLPKVQFGEPNDTNATKGDSVAFATVSLTGNIFPDATGTWKEEQTFPTEEEARTFLNGKAGITVV